MRMNSCTQGWSWPKLVFVGFAVIAAVLLLAEHRLHVLPYLPWLFLLACPLMHLFHHGGHSGGHNGSERQPSSGDKP